MAFIFSYITAIILNSEKKLEGRELIYIGIFFALFLIADFIFEIKIEIYTIIQIWLCAIILILIINNKKITEKFKTIKVYEIVLTTILSLGMILGIVFKYEKIGQNAVKGYLQNNDANEKQVTSYGTIPDFKDAVDYIQEKDKGFYNIMKSPYYGMNTSMWMGYNAIGGYFSILSQSYQRMSKELLNSDYYRLNFGIHEFDYRTKIGNLLGEKYLIMNEKNVMPYGYTKLEDYNGESDIYINNYNLPFGTLYTNYIDKEEYQVLTPLQKESSLLKTATVEKDELKNTELKHMEQFDYNTTIKEVDYKIIDENNILSQNNTVTTSSKKYSIQLEVEEIENSEIYLYVGGLKYNPITFDGIEQIKRNNKWYEPWFEYAIGVGIEDIMKFQKTQDALTAPYYIENRRDFI